jgi:hypothetical protein
MMFEGNEEVSDELERTCIERAVAYFKVLCHYLRKDFYGMAPSNQVRGVNQYIVNN